jgi:outer membrane PBP1 activator LpoA protein
VSGSRCLPVVIAVALLAACGGSSESTARKLRQTQESWQATVQLTSELRQRDAVPEEYARQTLDAAREELDKTSKKLEQLSE